jgi:hypothetical protein
VTAIEIRFPAPRPGEWARVDTARDAVIRKDVLRMASTLTASPSAKAVVGNVVPLLAWLSRATSRTELEARYTALLQQHTNTTTAPTYTPDNGTAQLLAGADLLLATLLPHRSATHQRGQDLATATT